MFDFIFNIKGLPALEALINQKFGELKTIVMTKAEELKNEITLLRQASAEERAEVAEALKNLDDKIADLELQVANGAGASEVQDAIDEVKLAKEEIQGIYNKPATSPNPTTSPNPGEGGAGFETPQV